MSNAGRRSSGSSSRSGSGGSTRRLRGSTDARVVFEHLLEIAAAHHPLAADLRRRKPALADPDPNRRVGHPGHLGDLWKGKQIVVRHLANIGANRDNPRLVFCSEAAHARSHPPLVHLGQRPRRGRRECELAALRAAGLNGAMPTGGKAIEGLIRTLQSNWEWLRRTGPGPARQPDDLRLDPRPRPPVPRDRRDHADSRRHPPCSPSPRCAPHSCPGPASSSSRWPSSLCSGSWPCPTTRAR
jgi:hypothetical protein